ncbi:hypothetical protein ACFVVQ_05870 [Paenibacillus chitinolyticus]
MSDWIMRILKQKMTWLGVAIFLVVLVVFEQVEGFQNVVCFMK